MVGRYLNLNVLLSIILIITFARIGNAYKRSTRYNHDIGLESVVPAGWTVPLQGGMTCTDLAHCKDSLTPPTSNSDLKYLTIGKGTITYSCADRGPRQPPVYIQQETYLYDVSQLIPKFSSENQFHSYIPRFLDYDYTSLDNSSLNCIGTVQTVQSRSVFELYHIDAFSLHVLEVVNSPNNSQYDLKWAHSSDPNNDWDIYRVETAGGGSPYDCGDQIVNNEIPSEYVAEYWIYKKTDASY